jgi:opacity protein-like surface antigen
MKKVSVVLLVMVLVASSAQALLVPVTPGSAGNTVAVTGTAGVNWITTGSTDTANTWRNRSLAAVGGDNWAGVPGLLPYSPYSQAAVTPATIPPTTLAPALFTTLTVQPYEEVDVWVLFSSSWKISLVGGAPVEAVNKNNWIDAVIDDGSIDTLFYASRQCGPNRIDFAG